MNLEPDAAPGKGLLNVLTVLPIFTSLCGHALCAYAAESLFGVFGKTFGRFDNYMRIEAHHLRTGVDHSGGNRLSHSKTYELLESEERNSPRATPTLAY